MTVEKLTQILGYEVVVAPKVPREIVSGYTSDLLSDVMGNACEGSVLITVQAHKNSVAVATQLDLPAIIFCNSRHISSDMREAAEREGIVLMRTDDSQFVASYKVHCALTQ